MDPKDVPAFLATKTGADPRGPANPRAHWRQCRQCGAACLAGLDADVMALQAFVDPTPLDARGEALALLSDRRTYTLRLRPKPRLDRRDADAITGEPAGTPGLTVLPWHHCHTPLAQPAPGLLNRRPAPLPAKPPF
jgi:hypothetical protein